MKTLRLGSVFLIILALSQGFAFGFVYRGNPMDTPAYTILTSEGTGNKAHYSDVNINPRDLVEGGYSTSPVVTSEYGYYPRIDLTMTKESTRGVPKSWLGVVENEGNAPFTFSITYETYQVGGADHWDFKLYMVTSESERAVVPSGTKFTAPDNGAATFEFVITPSAAFADSPSGSIGSIRYWINNSENYPPAGSTVNADGAPYAIFHYYRGVRGQIGQDPLFGFIKWYQEFGGTRAVFYPYNELISSPDIKITRIATVDSPDNYLLGRHDPVPGSLYTRAILVTNEGNAAALNTVVIDKVPANCTAFNVNVQEELDNVNATGLAYNGFGEGAGSWEAFYTTDVDIDMSYNGAGWTSIGAADTVNMEIGEPNATYIKFQYHEDGMPAGKRNIVQWSAYIR